MKPEDLAKSGTEHGEQMALFCWSTQPEQLRRYGNLLRWMYAIPNQGQRNVVEGGRKKAEGMKAGVADVCLPVAAKPPTSAYRFCGLYIEMKRANGKLSDLTEEQREFGDFVTSQGYAWVCCFGWRAAANTIEAYLHEFVKPNA